MLKLELQKSIYSGSWLLHTVMFYVSLIDISYKVWFKDVNTIKLANCDFNLMIPLRHGITKVTHVSSYRTNLGHQSHYDS